MADQTGRASDKFMLRLPDGMRERIKAAAEQNGRSMNAEIVQALDEVIPVLVEWEDTGLIRLMDLLDISLDHPERFTDENRAELETLIEKHLKVKK